MNQLQQISERIISPSKIESFIEKNKNEKIVFTNGCFDIIHQGHIKYLAQAADLGTKLVIGLNTDASVKRLKGESRPINDEYSRALVLASLSFVDAVIYFSEDTPLNLIKQVKPSVLVKGGDYDIEKIVGYDFVTKNGGTITTINFVDGFSSTSIINKSKLV